MKGLDDKILDSIDVESIESEVLKNCEFYSEIEYTIVLIDKSLKDSIKEVVTGNPKGSNSAVSNGNSTSTTKNKVKLPKLFIKTFSERPTEWTSFWQSFNSAIHSNTDLNDIDKFNYLHMYLEQSAADTMSGLKLNSANYHEAIKLLTNRFGNKQIIVGSCMDSLQKLPVVETMDLKKLRSLYDHIEGSVRSLSSVGIKAEMAKLPAEIRIEINKSMPGHDDDIEDNDQTLELERLLQAFRKELQIREKCNCVPLSNKKEFTSASSSQQARHQPTVATLYTENDKVITGKFVCVYCKGRHSPDKCNIITDYSARKNILRQQARCFLCLKSGHVLRNCRNTSYKCLNCHGRHHISICDKLQTRIEGQGVVTGIKIAVLGKRSSSEVSVTTGWNPTNVEKVITGCKFVGGQGNSVLLQTAIAPVSSSCDSSVEIRARQIFDNCSQRSHVTSALKKELKLPVLGSQIFLLKTYTVSRWFKYLHHMLCCSPDLSPS